MSLLWTILLFDLAVKTAAICYTPEGQNVVDTKYYNPQSSTYTPCNPDLNTPSTCCSQDQSCGNDNLCRDSAGGIYRQYCTQSNWETTHCSQLCPQYRDAGVILTSCPDGSFCCGFNNSACCNAGNGTLLNAQGQVLLSNGQVSTIPGASYSMSSTSTSSSTSSSTSLLAIQSASASAILSTTVLASPTLIPGGVNHASSMPIGAIVGGAVGGVALLLLIVILVLLVLRHGKRKDYKQPAVSGDPRLGGPATREMVSELNVHEEKNAWYSDQDRWIHGGHQPHASTYQHQYPVEADSKAVSNVYEVETPPRQLVELSSERNSTHHK